MASTTQQQGDKNSVKEIFKSLSYGPAPEADNVAQVGEWNDCQFFACQATDIDFVGKLQIETGVRLK